MARGLLGFTQVFTLPAQMLALSLPPSDHALPSEPRRRRGTAIVWRPHTEGFATIAYRDGRAIAGISGPWSNQYVLIWWQPAQPIHEVQVFDSLDEARRAVDQATAPRPSHLDTLLATLRREREPAKPSWLKRLGAVLLGSGARARRSGTPLQIHRTRACWRGEETDLRGLNFRAVR
jgi:hypothetical protein